MSNSTDADLQPHFALSGPRVPTELQDSSNDSNKFIEPAACATAAIDGYDGISWDRIPKFKLPAQPSQRRAWIWKEGYEIEEVKTGNRHWLCKKCHAARKQKAHVWKVSGGTGIPIKHMKEVHQLTEDGPVTKKRSFLDAFKQPDGTLTARDRDIVHQLITVFSPERFKTKLTRWIVHDNIAFN
jgi:hypothetical protein